MQRVYSMRDNIRATTAASLENPFAPVSMAKSRRFISDNIGHAIRKSTGGVLAPELAKKLAKLVAMEKNTLRSMETASKERMDGARALANWAEEQEDDIADVIDKVAVLLNEVGDLEDQYVDRYDQYRGALKQVRNIEKVVQPLRNKKQKTIDQIAKMKDEEAPDAAKLETLENEFVQIEAELLVAEQQLTSITHEKIKSGFAYQFSAMQEFGEKMAIIAGYGQHLLELIQDVPNGPGEERPAYTGYDATTAIVEECDRTLTTWVGSHANVTAELPTRVRSMMSSTSGEDVSRSEASGPKAADVIMAKARKTRRWSSESEGDANDESNKGDIGVAS